MEQEQMNGNLNPDFFEFPPLNDMKEIISEFENSGVADKVEEIFNEMESELEVKSGDSVIEPEFNVKEEIRNDEKSEFKLMLNEKDICDIDFEISKDIFDDVQIKNENFPENIMKRENNFKSNDSIPVPDDIKSSDSVIKESINFIENSKTEEVISCSRSNVNVVPENSIFIVRGNIVKENENIFSSTVDGPKLTSILIKNNKGNKNTGDCIKSRFCESDINSEDKENIGESSKKRIKRTREGSELTIKDCSIDKNQNNDTIQSVIESVIKASIQESDCVESKEERVETKETNTTKEDNSCSDSLNKIPLKKKSYGLFDVIVPLIGKNVMQPGNDTPFNHRYDLAKKRNELRAKFQQKNTDFPSSNLSYQEWRHKRESRSKEEIENEEKENTLKAIKLAAVVTKIAIRILREYSKDEPNETDMIKCFLYFESLPISPLSLLYSPHFVHTMMLCRGDEDLSPKLRRVANDSYEKCHALFPIPEGYNFETVYTSEVKKNIPDEFNNLDELELDYGDYDSSDFEDDESASNCDSEDKDWE